MMKILNKEVIQLLKDFREKIKDAMRMHPQFTEFKNLYFFRIVDKESREVIDKQFDELRDIMKYYKTQVTKSDKKEYYLVRRFDNKENIIQL